ncbi:venom acid phosphatase Acph-1 isoform X2 [Orussus abietinus]|uniref:venom acid phosphatase Acph-1 isoform X2 n=1 Tax=Orussus abietinus TaxID=222816 RepID=UPI000C715BEA|nr:venom acid phosphatase Acph-1 isoform X2 [Orussus abietinus]
MLQAGKATMYKFGEFLRNRYRHKSGYLKLRDVTCWSNDVEYSKSSASLVLASLLKPRTDEIWNTKLQWQPANVKYLPWPMDKLFFGHYCPRYSSELKRVISENKLWRNMTLSLRNLAEETGKDMQRPDDVYRIYQNYLSLVNCKLNPPKALQHSLDLLEKASQLRLKLGSATRLLRQLNGGELLKKVLQDVEGSMQGQNETRLKLVQVLFRHGERTPLAKEMYPKDVYTEADYEPWGLGQLTNKGKMREYRIGEMLRNRYDQFLGRVYRPAEVYAYSTDLDRTKVSLQLVLAGLYPPTPSQKWNPNLPWLPIPTIYFPEKVDILMRPHFCKGYIDAFEKAKKIPEVVQRIQSFSEFFKFLSEKSGINIVEPAQVYEIYNLLTAQIGMKLKLPDWCTDDVLAKMSEVVVFEYERRSYTAELKKRNGGVLVKRFLENMGVNGTVNMERKLYLYSGHEINVAAFNRVLDIKEPVIPTFGTAMMVELHEDNQGRQYIRIIAWTGVDERLITAKVAGCEDLCPLETFLDFVKDRLPSDQDLKCIYESLSKENLIELFAERKNQN